MVKEVKNLKAARFRCASFFSILTSRAAVTLEEASMAKQRSKTLPAGTTRAADIVIPRTPIQRIRLFDPSAFLAQAGLGRTIVDLKTGQTVFSQGDQAEAVFYIQRGKVRVSVISSGGKEATIALLAREGIFRGREHSQLPAAAHGHGDRNDRVCRSSRSRRKRWYAHSMSTMPSPTFSSPICSPATFAFRQDLVDQLFNSSEKRLARVLLLLAQFGKDATPETVIPKISQEVLAEMVGTTRARVNFFMNRFRKLGFIEYNGSIQVHPSLLGVVLHD